MTVAKGSEGATEPILTGGDVFAGLETATSTVEVTTPGLTVVTVAVVVLPGG